MAQSEAITRARRPDLWARYKDKNKASETQDDVVSDIIGQKDQTSGKKLS
jgi:tRNA G37 N-methylase TrmD